MKSSKPYNTKVGKILIDYIHDYISGCTFPIDASKVFEEAHTRYEKEHPEVLKENDEETGMKWYDKHINNGFFYEIINAIGAKMESDKNKMLKNS